MMTTIGKAQKKQKILELLDTKDDLFIDEKFKFDLDCCSYLAKDDINFLMDVARKLHSLRVPN